MTDTDTAATRAGERIAKVMARAGLCSRRDAETWIAAGRVAVNGATLTSPAFNVGPADVITVDGEPLRARERTRLWLYHKPRGLVTTARDPEGRSTIFDALPEDIPRVLSIGRLDINTEGLLLLTNDGGLARIIELPQTGWLRRYRVRAHGAVEPQALEALKRGLTIDGVDYRGIEARIDRQQGANVWLTMGLREGKNREIKRVLEHLGLAVNRLIRLSFGPFELRDLEPGAVQEVPTRILADQIGPRLAAEAGADFTSPLIEIETREARWARTKREREERRSGERAPPRRGDDRRWRREEEPVEEAAPAKAPDRHGRPERRRHVSAIREAARHESRDGRRRTVRDATVDRRGRAVPVERVARVKPQDAEGKAAERGKKRPRRGDRERDRERESSPRGEKGARSFHPRDPSARKPGRSAGGPREPAARDRSSRGGAAPRAPRPKGRPPRGGGRGPKGR